MTTGASHSECSLGSGVPSDGAVECVRAAKVVYGLTRIAYRTEVELPSTVRGTLKERQPDRKLVFARRVEVECQPRGGSGRRRIGLQRGTLTSDSGANDGRISVEKGRLIEGAVATTGERKEGPIICRVTKGETKRVVSCVLLCTG